ncbi:uncharacterized protein BDR25DRAFT_316141 [Lindgomyces ingoldianus]|uniref:Uncharacterized protein n=1 Tax=Lindgomyces ingoldianus TaxID=673940 RepID=A0ACB6QP56_9PLEO|nr:uncharacterized protein BDR25DRAFT_316141 [Lindgomyces ingoldianus]KAF2468353.1 hypothetical protein BDR25DRAFT_316141 [Lindgomyces ingoldianus]
MHPDITRTLGSSPEVADVATGTGVFLRLLNSEMPSGNYVGFDISLGLFPNPKDLPSNIKLQTLDAKEAVLEHSRHKFDLVHISLLAAGVDPSEWPLVVSNAWTECNWANARCLKGEPGSRIDVSERWRKGFADGLGERFSSSFSTLAENMRSAGLGSVSIDVVSSDRVSETRERMTRNNTKAVMAWAAMMIERGIIGSVTLDEFAGEESKVAEEIRTGCYVRYDVYTVIGRMPYD